MGSEACCAETTAQQAGAVGSEVSHREPKRRWQVFGLLFVGSIVEEREVRVKRLALPGLLQWRYGGEPSQGCEVRLVRVKMFGCAQQARKQQDECMHESACMSHVHRHSAVVTQPTA